MLFSSLDSKIIFKESHIVLLHAVNVGTLDEGENKGNVFSRNYKKYIYILKFSNKI